MILEEFLVVLIACILSITSTFLLFRKYLTKKISPLLFISFGYLCIDSIFVGSLPVTLFHDIDSLKILNLYSNKIGFLIGIIGAFFLLYGLLLPQYKAQIKDKLIILLLFLLFFTTGLINMITINHQFINGKVIVEYHLLGLAGITICGITLNYYISQRFSFWKEIKIELLNKDFRKRVKERHIQSLVLEKLKWLFPLRGLLFATALMFIIIRSYPSGLLPTFSWTVALALALLYFSYVIYYSDENFFRSSFHVE